MLAASAMPLDKPTEVSKDPLTTAGKPISVTRSSACWTPPNGIALTTKMSAANRISSTSTLDANRKDSSTAI